MTRSRKILKARSEKGFTLLETLLVVGLTTLIAVGIVAALIEGLDTLNTVTDAQNVEFGHQRIMTVFLDDVRSATWFYNGTTHTEDGSEVESTFASSSSLIMGYEGPDGDEVWIKYGTRPGVLSPIENKIYLIRTVATTGPQGEGSSIIASGIENFEFVYYDIDGNETFDLTKIRRVVLTVSIQSGGAVVERTYDAVMRNRNLGLREPVSDMTDIEDESILK